MKRIALGLTAAVIGGTACWPVSSDTALGEMQVERLSGTVTLLRDGSEIDVSGPTDMQAGDVVVTGGGSSRAALSLEGIRDLELAPSGRVEVGDGASVLAQQGSLLAEVTDRTVIRFGEAEARAVGGVFRVDLGFGVARAAVYRGTAFVSSPGQTEVEVPALYEASVAANARVLARRPMQISEEDRWDRLRLGAVLALDERLVHLGDGLASQLGTRRPGLDFYAGLAPGGVGFMRGFLSRPVSDLLIGFTVAGQFQGGLDKGFERAFQLFDEGARWGLVATILDVRANPLVAELRDIVLSTGVVSQTGGSPQFGAAGTTGGSAAPGPGGSDAPPPDDSGGGNEDGGGDGGEPGGGGGGEEDCNGPLPGTDCLISPLPTPPLDTGTLDEGPLP